MEFLLHLIFVASALYVVINYYSFAFKGRVPHSPAALGKALVAPTLIFALSLFVFGFIQKWIVNPFLGGVPIYEILSFMSALLSSSIAGWVSSRTVEDTQTMNLKILGIIGIVPFSIVIFIGFLSGPSWVIWVLVLAYFPMLYLGYRAYLKYT